MKSPPRRALKKREFPERLRPLADVVELANLTNEEEIEKLRSAQQRLAEANREAIGRTSRAVSKTAQDNASLREQTLKAAKEIKLIGDNFSARMSGHEKAISTLLDQMRIGEHPRFHRGNFLTLFPTIAAVRRALWTVARELAIEGNFVHLPEICNTPPALVRRVDGRVRVFAVPVSTWLLPMLDGLKFGQLKICEACWKLYVARRRDQLGCSRKCGDTVYMRRYRRPKYRSKNKPGSEWRKSRTALNDLMRKRGQKQ